ncbi:methylmalonyl-CoA mutase family protein [Rugosimonospora acidiphila]|uniref:Methylmalonyl-CoA mutase family protein n=1 Tax=Rugosimonospora acidiphila TaxID=556531 RepID=A0ABP9SLR8_9ACTN
MPVAGDDLRLAEGFPAATQEQWRRLALGALRKARVATEEDTEERVSELLSTQTYDGFSLSPLYGADATDVPNGRPGQPPFTRGASAAGAVVAGWDVRTRHVSPDRAAVLSDLEQGATSLWFVLGDGFPVKRLPEVLEGVYLELAGIVLDPGPSFDEAARLLFELAAERGLDPTELRGSLGADPLGWLARAGGNRGPDGMAELVALARRCAAGSPGLRSVTVDATAFHDAGGSDAQELGCALAAGVAYLRALTDGGLSVAQALGQLEFRYAATVDQFGTIAKLRAARRLWARVAEVCGEPESGGQRQHAVTSSVMMTSRDPWVNLLRGTVAAFAAGVGGADAVTVLPFDHAIGAPDGFSLRLARNTQILLIEESNVARVVDPAGGSWYVEQRTDDLAMAAWAWFTEIERAGGLATSLHSGFIAERLAATWQRRVDRVAHRLDPITGVSEFPLLDERRPDRPPAPTPPSGGLPRHRHAENFEWLRDRADRHATTTGQRPAVLVATLGSAAAHGPRLTFTTNLLAAGGITATVAAGDDPAAAGAALAASGTPVAFLCGPDRSYPELAGPVAAALRGAGARSVWLAGKGEHDGVTGTIATGGDALAVLSSLLDDLGVAS